MARFGELRLTAIGLKAQHDNLNGVPIKFTSIGLGSGFFNGNVEDLTCLEYEEISIPVTDSYVKDGYFTVAGFMSNENIEIGFECREIGLYIEDENGVEVLYSYANAGTEFDYIPATSDERYAKNIRIVTGISNADYVSIPDTPGDIYVPMVTFKEFKEKTEADIEKLHKTGTYAGNGTADKRTITVNETGEGNVLMIWRDDESAAYSAIAMSNGAICFSGSTMTMLGSGQCSFANGVLTIASNYSHINESEKTYRYQVL